MSSIPQTPHMDTNAPHKRGKKSHNMDLSVPFTLYVNDVAQLLGITPGAVGMRIARGTIPVQPKPRNNSKSPFEWSSLDWWKYYNGKK
jgi:hypothetical protein